MNGIIRKSFNFDKVCTLEYMTVILCYVLLSMCDFAKLLVGSDTIKSLHTHINPSSTGTKSIHQNLTSVDV